MASESLGPSFRPSLTKSTTGRVSSVPQPKSKSSSSEGSSRGAPQAPLHLFDCVESASEQVGIGVGPRVHLLGVKRLASPSGTLDGVSLSTSGRRTSGQLPLGQLLASVSTSVFGQDPVQQASVPIGRGGHEDASSLKLQCPSSLPIEQSCPSSSPMLGHCLSRSPQEGLCLSSSPIAWHNSLSLPVASHHPSVRCPLLDGKDDLAMEVDDYEKFSTDNIASQNSAGNSDLFACRDSSQVADHENVKDVVLALRDSATSGCSSI